MSAHSDRRGESAAPILSALDPDVHNTLSTLYAKVLVCEAQWQGLGRELDACRGCSPAQRADRERRRAELGRELMALREQVDRVRREADPAGTFL